MILILRTSGLETDAVLKDKTSVQDLVAGTTTEVVNSGYARKTLTDASLAAIPSPDLTNDRYDIDIPDQTWTSVGAGDGWSKFVVCYDADTTTGSDATLVPLTAHDFIVVPDGSDITAQIATAGFFRAP